MKVLLTGGAGYIGSHIYRQLKRLNHKVAVIDNLSNGHREAIDKNDLFVFDLTDLKLVENVITSFKPDIVMHFAAFIEVGISVQKPFDFFSNNSSMTINLIQLLHNNGINKFIFSSTAALYGFPKESPITEKATIAPINPYGTSKFLVEKAMESLSEFSDFNYVSIRYFNAAGADESGEIGEAHQPETHLIPLVLKTATNERENIKVFGTDYPTKDGTAIRDYIHVNDLADAHILAMEYLMNSNQSNQFNCGYSMGYSVKEIIDVSKKITKKDINTIFTDRRSGDSSELVADSSKIKKVLNWNPKYNDIEYIIKTAWNWEKNRKF